MSNTVELLSLQIQNDMLSKLLETQKSSSISSLGSSSDSGGLSFEQMLESTIGELSGASSGTSDSYDTTALLQSMGIYNYSTISGAQPVAVGNMNASSSLVSFIKAKEGYSATAYRGADVQNQTIGYGHVLLDGENYTTVTQSQATKLLTSDLSSAVASVNKEFAGTKLTQNQFDSLVSFAYNLGSNIWSGATKLVGDIKSGASTQTLKNDFTQYDHCNGSELAGLYNRRVDEWSMFTSGNYNLNT